MTDMMSMFFARLPIVGLTMAALLALPGCGPQNPDDRIRFPGPIKGAFAVSNYFTPSGHMGDGELPGFLHAAVRATCKEPRPAGAQGYCYNFTYIKRGNLGWAGVYWVYPANNWGARPGRRVENSAAFKQVRFFAASDKPVRLQFFYGNVMNIFLPHQDTVRQFGGENIGPEWKQLRLDVTIADSTELTNLIGGFGWAIKYPDGEQQSEPHFPNGDGSFQIYLDDIVWDTDPPPPLPASEPDASRPDT